MFIAMEEVFRLVFGPYPLAFPAHVPLPTLHIGGAVVTGVELAILIVGVVVLVATWFTLRHTRLGLAWRATSQDRETASGHGHQYRSGDRLDLSDRLRAGRRLGRAARR